MKKNNLIIAFVLAIAISAFLVPEVYADFYLKDIVEEGQIFDEHYVDLDNDGIPEKIALKSYNLNYYEKQLQHYFGQLVVFKSIKNKYVQIWGSPKVSYKENENIPGDKNRFFFGNYGMEPLEIVGDINADGKIQILSPAAQSDVRPTKYRFYEWDGKKFNYIKSGFLLSSSLENGKYEWKKNYIFENGTFKNPWISFFTTLLKPGYLVGRIVSYNKSQVSFWGETYIKSEKDSFNVKKILDTENEK